MPVKNSPSPPGLGVCHPAGRDSLDHGINMCISVVSTLGVRRPPDTSSLHNLDGMLWQGLINVVNVDLTLVGKYFTHSLRNICGSTGFGWEEELVLFGVGPGKMSALSHNGMLKS